MTTIAATATQIAADKQATHSGGLKFKMTSKIQSFDNKTFYKTPFHVGLAGNVDTFADIWGYFQYPEQYKKMPKLKGEGIILSEDGRIWTFVQPTIWLRVDGPHYAIGTGMNFAMGAMTQGGTAVDAVKAAMKLDPNTGIGITRINIKGK